MEIALYNVKRNLLVVGEWLNDETSISLTNFPLKFETQFVSSIYSNIIAKFLSLPN